MSIINIDFLQYCLNNKLSPETLQNIDWSSLYSFGQKHAISGILFDGIKQLPKEMTPPRNLLLKWFSLSEQIRKRNVVLNNEVSKLCKVFREEGLRCCILKGQGNALMYPNPYSRMPGDIDIWVMAERERIMAFTKEHFGVDDMRFHHVEVDVGNGVIGEIHFFPLYMNNPIYNRRLQKWFKQTGDLQCSNIKELPDDAGIIAVPTTEFNVIYQMGHIFHHFFDEGIGLKQLIDYYYLLRENEANNKDEIRNKLKYFGLYNFARAVMYVEKEALGLEDKYLIAEPDVKRGKSLLDEILNGGNFGRHYTKYNGFTRKGMAEKYFLKIYRNMHFIKSYPAEALFEPIFRTWHFFWRLWNKNRQK